MRNCHRAKLSILISQCSNTEKITDMEKERYITLSSYGKGAHERVIKDDKYPVPFLGYRVKSGQFIYSRIDARNGAYGIIPPELDGYVVSKDFPVYDIDAKKVLPRFLLRSVLSIEFINQVKRSSFGATNRMRIKEEVFENYSIPLPPLAEQRRIVAVLDKVGKLLDQHKQQLALLDDLIKARFVEMFGNPIDNPRRWPLRQLGELGCWSSGGTPARSNPSYFLGDIDWYSAGELNSLFLHGSSEKITRDAIDNSAAKLFDAGSMLVGMYDTAAFKMGILRNAASCNQACACITPNDLVDLVWLYHMLQAMKNHFLSLRHGVRQKNLNLGMIKEFTIPVPDKAQQLKFSAFVAQVDKSKSVVQKSLEETQLLFDSLMQKYFG